MQVGIFVSAQECAEKWPQHVLRSRGVWRGHGSGTRMHLVPL